MLSPHHTRYRTTHRLTQLLCVVLLFIHSVASGKEIPPIQTFPHDGYVLSVAFSSDPEGKHILTGSGDKTAVLWDRQGEKIKIFPHNDAVSSVAFSPDGKHILTGSSDKTAVLWDRQGERIQTFPHSHWVRSVAFSPDPEGKHILTGSSDNAAVLWDRQGEIIQTFPHNNLSSVAFSPDGEYILTGSGDKTAVLWDRQGKKIRTFPHNATVYSVAFSPDGKHILTGSYDDIAVLWDRQGENIKTFPHNNWVWPVAFSPDGKHILTGSRDKTAVLWNRQGKKIKTFPHSSYVYSVAFSRDGKYILTGSGDGHARLFAIPQPYVFPENTSNDTGFLTIEEVATMAKFGAHIRYDGEDSVHAIDPSDSPEKVITAVELLLRDLHLDRLPPWLGKFTQLTHLDISNNQLQLDDLALLRGFNQLENLNLANNPVFNKFIGTGGLFEHLPKLRILNLRNTGFENSELAGLSLLRGLLELDVSSNAISALSLPKLTQLQTLLANNNQISQITLAEVTQLTHLELNHNRLDTLDLNAIPDGIISIKAQSNNMKKLQFDSERDKRALEVLDLKNNNKLILPDSMGGAFVLQRLTRLGRDDSVRIPGILERKLPKAN